MEKQNNIEIPVEKEEVVEEPFKAQEKLKDIKLPEQEIEEINRQISEIEGLIEVDRKRKEAEVEKIKPQEFDDFIRAVEGVARVLRERDSQKLDQLTEDPGKIARMISSLRSALSSQNPDTDGVARAIGGVANFIGELGERQARGATKENPDSLGKLAYFLTKIDQERQALGGRISKKENASDILSALSRIESAIKSKKAGIGRKLAFIKQYRGR